MKNIISGASDIKLSEMVDTYINARRVTMNVNPSVKPKTLQVKIYGTEKQEKLAYICEILNQKPYALADDIVNMNIDYFFDRLFDDKSFKAFQKKHKTGERSSGDDPNQSKLEG